jgi:hypothetical protein
MAIAPLSVVSPFTLLPTSAVSSLLPAAGRQELTAIFVGSTVVELSGLGKLLSAADVFQEKLAVLQPGSTASGLGDNFGADFASLAAEVQYFVDAFNTLQSELASLQGPLGGFTGRTLATRFSHALNTQVAATIPNGAAGPTSLVQVGLELQPASTTGASSKLGIDLQTLRSAFESNPAGNFSLLTKAVESFRNVATDFAGQATGKAAALGTLGIVTQLGLGQSVFGQLELSNLLAFSSFNSGDTTTLTRQLVALAEFHLVSTLLE